MDDYREPCSVYGIVKSMHHAGKWGESAAIAKLLVLPSSRPHPAIQKQLKIVLFVCQACPGRKGQSTKILEKELLTPHPGPFLSHCTSLVIFKSLFVCFFKTSNRSSLIYANSLASDSYMDESHACMQSQSLTFKPISIPFILVNSSRINVVVQCLH